MPSSKGIPKNPELREQLKAEIQKEKNKDGGGSGKWSAWKATKLAKKYEEAGGGYENQAGSKNKPSKGAPKPKARAKKDEELKKDQHAKEDIADETKHMTDSPTAKMGKEVVGEKGQVESKAAVERKPSVAGSRKSARLADKRCALEAEDDEA